MNVAQSENITAQKSSSEDSTQTTEEAEAYKNLTLKELMDLEVTSVSRRPEKLSQSASAIQVITQEDIRRSGATRIPEVLRLASNLEVAQIDSSNWAISSRGFNSNLANKLLVMMDGRTLYTPLFAGVFWDVQDTLLEDIDRIEVISGPGATVWGANAVNGVINITTKNVKETQGLLLLGGGGNELHDFVGIRYGGTVDSNLYYRFYGKYFDRGATVFPNGQNAENEWRMGQGGFRVDWERSAIDLFTFQGDIYDGGQANGNDLTTTGGNLIGRWSHTTAEDSGYTLQLYFDRAHRKTPGSFNDVINTFDLDFQHRLPLGQKHDVVWGAGYRVYHDNFESGPSLAFLPPDVTHQLFSVFFQDEVALMKDQLHLTFGTKVEHNDYTGFEVQPSVRLAWNPDERQTVWGAISRAVRMPSRIDRDLFVPSAAPFLIAGGPNFVSEELLAYELGYRIQPDQRVLVSLAAFYNDYDKLRSVEQANPPIPVPLVIENEQEGESYGAELTMDSRLTDRVRIWAGYTEMRIHIRPKPGSTDRSFGSGESHDSNRHFLIHPSLDLSKHFQLDTIFRYVSEIKNQSVPGYAELDLRLAWMPIPGLEFSIVGQNLLHDRHVEFGQPATRQEIQRSVYGKIVWRY